MRAPYSWRTRLWGLACMRSGQILLASGPCVRSTAAVAALECLEGPEFCMCLGCLAARSRCKRRMLHACRLVAPMQCLGAGRSN